MKLETKFSCGDSAYVPQQRDRFGAHTPFRGTIGQVRVEFTDSPGLPGEDTFDNYRPQSSYKESYMLVETGIGTGNVYTLGEHIFATIDECREAIWKMEKEKQ